ncbi:hypothetical protein [Streptomyces sp. NPDC006012]|uniref:hypothetical protein n=1 Tax=Streptomyces sp. NPDC006012 TaxID=3364739 RepID=UPI0036C6987D
MASRTATRRNYALLVTLGLSSSFAILGAGQVFTAESTSLQDSKTGFCGDTTTAENLQKYQGIPVMNQTKFQDIVEHDNHTQRVYVDVRPTNPDSVEFLINGKGQPKPMEVKAKTIKDADLQIDVELKEGDKGKVGFFNPPEKSYEGELKKRYEQRRAEYSDLGEKMKDLEKDGYTVKGGIVFLKEKPLVGDHDVFDIHKLDDKRVSVPEHDQLIEDMKAKNMAVMHGAHMFWVPVNKKEEAMKEGIIKEHSAPPEGGGEKLVRFIPNQPPRLVFAGEKLKGPNCLTQPQQTEGK